MDGMNITIGGYTTQNFDMSLAAVRTFQDLWDRCPSDQVLAAIKAVDRALGIEKDAIDKQTASYSDLDSFDDAVTEAEDILDGLEELPDVICFLRDAHEPNLIDLLDFSEKDHEEIDGLLRSDDEDDGVHWKDHDEFVEDESAEY